MPEITLGWIEQAGSLSNLRKVVEILADSPSIRRSDFLNRIRTELSVREWTADNYARFAHALGFASYGRITNAFILTRRGQQLVSTRAGSSSKNEVLEKGLLSNPPVVRVLELLRTRGHLTKFELGQNLGFGWEKGFTNYPQDALIIELEGASTRKQRSRILSNREGTADKYARMICSWAKDRDWVVQEPKTVTVAVGTNVYSQQVPQSYIIAAAGIEALGLARGESTRARVRKIVPSEMLCSGRHPNFSFIRKRRAEILKILQRGTPYTVRDIVSRLGASGITANDTVVELDLKGLGNCGFNIINGGPAYTLRDALKIEHIPVPSVIHISDIDRIVQETSRTCTSLPNDFLNLIPYSFDKKSSRFFESRTYELFKNLMGFQAELLGGPLEPDVIAWHINTVPAYGIIIDCKSRAQGYSIQIDDQRQMRDYIRDFATQLERKGAQEIYFLFATSKLKGNFRDALRNIQTLSTTPGAAISSGNMLYLAHRILARRFDLRGARSLFGCLDEIDQARIDRI